MKKVFDENARLVLFNEIKSLEFDVQHLAGLVQNEMPIDLDDINHWVADKNRLIDKLASIQAKIKKYYFDEGGGGDA